MLGMQGSPYSRDPTLPCWNLLTLSVNTDSRAALPLLYSLSSAEKEKDTQEHKNIWKEDSLWKWDRMSVVASFQDGPLCSCHLVFKSSFSLLPHGVPRWFVWLVEYGRSDGMSLSRLDVKWHGGFHVGCPLSLCPTLEHSLWEKSVAISWVHSGNPRRSHVSRDWYFHKQSCKWAFLDMNPPASATSPDRTTHTLRQNHPAKPPLIPWLSESMG